MRFGIFLAPFHRPDENPTLALQRDLELIERLDELGYDEAWIGEHHSAGSEIIASPEVFIAAAAERTKRIRLGTGVSSLPYHHPLLLADRMVLLDHLTRGRAMLGVGPGALASDAYMLGIEPAQQRDMMEEALEAIIALLTSPEPVSRKTSWFTLQDARLPPELADIKVDDLIDLMNMSGLAVVGTPDMAIEAIRRLEKQSGGFGTYLFMSHEWADRQQTLRSYELFSRYVIPEINGTTASLTGSRDWVA